ncbi:MAG: hypothetical protein ABR501_09705 [Pyrinomonadaceae bacterium]
MFGKLTALIVLIAVACTVAAGMPAHSDTGESAMMDCCKKALDLDDSPQVAASRLCCAMNCSNPASHNRNSGQNFSQSGTASDPAAFMTLCPPTHQQPLRARYEQSSSKQGKPAYLLYLALLI